MMSIKFKLAFIFILLFYGFSNRVQTTDEIRYEATMLYNNGHYKDLIDYLYNIESQPRFNYTLLIDTKIPSLYSYRGAALASHAFRDQMAAVQAFENATYFYPNDTRSWINLGT